MVFSSNLQMVVKESAIPVENLKVWVLLGLVQLAPGWQAIPGLSRSSINICWLANLEIKEVGGRENSRTLWLKLQQQLCICEGSGTPWGAVSPHIPPLCFIIMRSFNSLIFVVKQEFKRLDLTSLGRNMSQLQSKQQTLKSILTVDACARKYNLFATLTT